MVSIRAAIRKQEAVVGEDKLKPKMDIMGDDLDAAAGEMSDLGF